MRAMVDMPMKWYAIDGHGEAVVPRDASTVDLSSSGIGFVSGSEARPGDAILVHLAHEPVGVDLALPAQIVRVHRSPGGYRLAAVFSALDVQQRAALGKFVVSLIGKRAA